MRHFVILFSFKAPRHLIDSRLLEEHLSNLRGGYDLGYVLMYGRRPFESGTLAVIRTEHAKAIGPLLATDPLIGSGLATFDFFEFQAEVYPATLEGWVNPLEFEEGGLPESLQP
jgi:hypothetical protein